MNIARTAWLITGGGRGLGRAVALAAARAGASVVVVARSRGETDAVAAAVRDGGGVAFALVADIGNKEHTYAIAGEAAALVGPIDVLVHAAGTLGPVPLVPLLETSCEDLERALSVNVVGPHRLARAVVPAMVLRGSGVVVHVSSDAALEAYPSWGAYAASKAAFEVLGRTLAAEVAGTGVRSLIVDPGEMDTRMHADAAPEAIRSTLARPDDVAARLVDLVSSPRRGPNGARVVLSHLELP